MAGEMVWMDLEMTGLDLKTESIIEIATIITAVSYTHLTLPTKA